MSTQRTNRRTRAMGAIAAAVLAGAVALSGLGVGTAGAAPPAQDGPTAAEFASTWLAAQLDAQIPMQNFGGPDWGVTLDATLGMVATGVGGAQVAEVWSTLESQRDAALAPGGVDSPGRLARAILLAEVLGEDPRAVGSGPGADLVARLAATMRTEGPDTGLFGSTSPTYDGAFRQGYALAALVAAGVDPDQRAVDWLLGQQCDAGADAGAWMQHRTDLTVPCAVDAVMFVGPDTNATSAAITGLAAVEAGADAIEGALDWLDRVQRPDGGWEQVAGYGTDPNSTALVLQGLLIVGAADDERFADRAAAPLGVLLSFQLGCAAPVADRGAFTFPGSNDAPNGFATAQAVPAAAGVPVLFEPADAIDALPAPDCNPATTTTVPPTTGPPTTATPTTATPTSATPTSATPTTGPTEVLGATQVPPARELALTGPTSGLLSGLGAALLVAGLALLAGSRRRGDL